MSLRNSFLSAKVVLFLAVAGTALCAQAAGGAAFGLPEGVQPTIGAWFCNDDFLTPEGYKKYVDVFAEQSPYDLLTTSFRINRREITEPAFHDQVKAAVAYARERGLKIALDLDVRLAREAFRSRYPEEQQEMLRLRTTALNASGEVEFAIESETLADHMTGDTTPYLPLSGRLVRVYAYATGDGGILPETVQDITARCVVKTASGAEVRVAIPCDASTEGRTACVMAAFTHLTPDVYAPHLLDFQRSIVMQYADVALSGLMKDEWGFPPCFGGSPSKNDFWFSKGYAQVYAEATNGRDLVRDCLLMHAGEQGRERERQAAINVLLKTARERNVAIEEHYYNLAKEFFGPKAAVVTHATWMPYPGPSEFKKNGLDWWAARRDWGQTDEDTPFPVRTALAKKWGSSVWYNQYYSTQVDDYRESLWSHALGGGRINYHPVYPAPEGMDIVTRTSALLAPDIVAGESRIRLLQLITRAPVDCPVAVVFGHACAMNWAGPAYDDVGLGVTDALWRAGYYADLIPTSEIASGALRLAEDGAVTYGAQRYASVVLYHPEFEQPETAAFFNKADADKTALFRTGEWTRDFSARDYGGVAALPKAMDSCSDGADAAAKAIASLRRRGIAPNTPATQQLPNKTARPGRAGHIRLTDGAEVFLSGKTDAAGDPITGDLEMAGRKIAVKARGVLAVRFTADGRIDALAAGGLKQFTGGGLSLQFDMPVDFAYWHDEAGQPKGALQDGPGPIPESLAALTKDWIRLATPGAEPSPAKPAAALAFPPELVAFTPAKGNPVFEGAGLGHWDENIRERGWILHEDNAYHLWYTGYKDKKGDTHKLGYATSSDGLHWERYPGNPIHSEHWIEDMMVIKVNGTYYMFAEGKEDVTHLLTSTDRIHWEEQGDLVVNRVNGEPISPGPFGTPTAHYEDGTWYLFYERNDEAIWLATSKDPKVWTNVQDEPIIECGPGEYDKAMIALDQVVKYGGVYYAYYHGLVPGTRPKEWTSAVAASTDLIHWEKYAGNPIVRGDKSSPELVHDGTAYRLYTMHPAVCVYTHPSPDTAPAKTEVTPVDTAEKTSVKSSFTVWQLPNQTRHQMMSYVIQTADNKIIVIDGGWKSDAAYLRDFIKARGGGVDAWFLTHVHDDHCEALANILQDMQGVEIKDLYASLADADWYAKVCSEGELKTYKELMASLEKSGRAFTMLSPGNTLEIGGLHIKVLGGCNPEILKNPINNSSMVLRFSDARNSMLFLADLGFDGGEKLLKSPFAADLPSDYVQMAHHGQNGVGEAVYKKINPKYCLWPTPKWLWDNDSGAGEDSGKYHTKEVRGWMATLPILKHYRMFEGLQTIE